MEQAIPILPVDDLGAAKEFYVDALGFRVRFEASTDGKTGILGLERGTRVRIHGLPGHYIVLDRMPSKWKRRIDIHMGTDVNAARSWGKRAVKIYWTATHEPKP